MRVWVLCGVVLLLTGCARPSTSAPPAPEPEPVIACVPISAAATAGLQWGFDERQPGFTVFNGQSLAIDGDEWLVAALFSGPGVDSQSGVWFTVNDPTSDAENAYLSVDAFAREFTVYAQPDGWSSAPDIVDDVRSCLK